MYAKRGHGTSIDGYNTCLGAYGTSIKAYNTYLGVYGRSGGQVNTLVKVKSTSKRTHGTSKEIDLQRMLKGMTDLECR